MYLSYDRYVELGGSIGLPSFTLVVREAERFVDRFTLNRIRTDFEVLEKDKVIYRSDLEILVFRLIGINVANDINSKGVASESNQGMSRSYIVASADEVLLKSASLVNEFLSGYVDHKGIRLLFRG